MTPLHQELGPVATSLDERLANLLTAYANEPGDVGETLRWAIEGWLTARAGLEAVKEVADDMEVGGDELREIVREGLEEPGGE